MTRRRIADFDVGRCRACGHVFVTDRLDDRLLADAYDRGYYARSERAPEETGYEDYVGAADERIRAFRDRLAKLERHLAVTPGRLLDYGSAVGYFVKVAGDAGWEAVGYERSEWAAEYGRKVLGVCIETGSGVDKFQAGYFDVVTMWDVLEHLQHPRDVIRAVATWLRPDGLLALTTVNSSSLAARVASDEWRHLAPPHHLQYFTRRSLIRLLELEGFKVLRVKGQGAALDSRSGAQELPALISSLDRIITHWRFRPIATALNLLDEIEVLAVKPATSGPALSELRQA